MKFKLVSCICIATYFLHADNNHNKLIIPSVNITNPYWEFVSIPITQKNEGVFEQLIKKWSKKIDILWKKLALKIRTEINASTTQLDFYLEDQRFIDVYVNHYRQSYANFMDEEEHQEIDPVVFNFLNSKINYLQLEKPVKICVEENLPFLTISFGTDQEGHYLLVNDKMFSNKNITNLYDLAINKKTKFHVEAATNLHLSRVIEYSNLLHLTITQSLSSVVHQNDYFAKLLQIFTFNKKILTKETQNYGIHYTIFQGYLEACLQSKNPVEAAIFIEPFLDNFNQEFVMLWREFIEDLENCYDEQNLATYQALALFERQQVLFTEQYDDHD